VTHPFAPLARTLAARAVRYLVIGVSGANLYAPRGQAVFVTSDIDIFVPTDADNLVRAWEAAEQAGLELWAGADPLDRPRDVPLAERVIEGRVLTSAIGPETPQVDITLVMAGFAFERAWEARREFLLEGTIVPAARLLHIVESKHAAGRPKDLLFLATHKDALETWLKIPDVG
jgi:hypothetical protein